MSTATEQQPWDVASGIAWSVGGLRGETYLAVEGAIKQSCLAHAAALTQENQRLRAACQKAYELSMMRSEPYIPQDVREQIESTLHAALEGKEGKT